MVVLVVHKIVQCLLNILDPRGSKEARAPQHAKHTLFMLLPLRECWAPVMLCAASCNSTGCTRLVVLVLWWLVERTKRPQRMVAITSAKHVRMQAEYQCHHQSYVRVYCLIDEAVPTHVTYIQPTGKRNSSAQHRHLCVCMYVCMCV
jgi:hypothetical protein